MHENNIHVWGLISYSIQAPKNRLETQVVIKCIHKQFQGSMFWNEFQNIPQMIHLYRLKDNSLAQRQLII